MKANPKTSHCHMYGVLVKMPWTEIPFSFNGEISYRCTGSVLNHGSGYLLSRAVRGGGYSVYCPGIVICKICFMCRIICWGFFYTLFSIGFLSVFKLWECQALGENYCNFPKKLDIFAIFLFFLSMYMCLYTSMWSMKNSARHYLNEVH